MRHARRRGDQLAALGRVSSSLADPPELTGEIARVLPALVGVLGQAGAHDTIGSRWSRGCTVETGGGSSFRIDAIRLARLPPWNARRPVAISKRTVPSAKTSVRASAALPSSCSGAMYGTVPRTMPSSVSGLSPRVNVLASGRAGSS